MISGGTDSLILLILQHTHGNQSWCDVLHFANRLVLHSSVYKLKLNVEISLPSTTNLIWDNATTDTDLILVENLLLFIVLVS